MATISRTYNYWLDEMADSRVKNWPFMSTPVPLIFTLIIYLMGIYVILPKFMENRKAFSLKTTIFYYNIIQIVTCTFLIWGTATSGWTTHYTFGCDLVDYSNDPLAVRMLTFIYYTVFLKMFELIETFFFILRKKTNQVSKLHVYHHASTLVVGWVACKYIGGGMSTFTILINSSVHIIMYTYYLLSSLGPEWQKRLIKWKPRITMIQMVQFCIIILHSLQVLKSDCNFSRTALYMYLPNIFIIFYMFYEFYKKNYHTNKQKQ